MNNDSIKTQIIVKEQKINVLMIDNKEYISLTDLARYADEDDPRLPIQNWMRNKDVISYLGLWESINNENFKGVEFDAFKNEAYQNKIDWHANRVLAKVNYLVHTDAIRSIIVSTLTEKQKKLYMLKKLA